MYYIHRKFILNLKVCFRHNRKFASVSFWCILFLLLVALISLFSRRGFFHIFHHSYYISIGLDCYFLFSTVFPRACFAKTLNRFLMFHVVKSQRLKSLFFLSDYMWSCSTLWLLLTSQIRYSPGFRRLSVYCFFEFCLLLISSDIRHSLPILLFYFHLRSRWHSSVYCWYRITSTIRFKFVNLFINSGDVTFWRSYFLISQICFRVFVIPAQHTQWVPFHHIVFVYSSCCFCLNQYFRFSLFTDWTFFWFAKCRIRSLWWSNR